MTCTDYCQKSHTIQAILKAEKMGNLTEHFSDIPNVFMEGQSEIEFLQDLQEAIHKAIQWEIGFEPFSPPWDLMKEMWEEDYHKFMGTARGKRVAYKTIMTLLDQSEFKIMKVAQQSNMVPKIYGTCGPAYLMASRNTV